MKPIDKFSDFITYGMLAIIIVFVIFVLDFSIMKSKAYHLLAKQEKELRYQKYVKD